MIVNGEKFSFEDLKKKNINSLLNHFNLTPERVAVELNGNIIKKAEFENTELSDSDKIEIIHFVGGGN